MEAPKNTQQKQLGDTATGPVEGSPFQVPSKVVKVPSVREGGKVPMESGVKTPGPND